MNKFEFFNICKEGLVFLDGATGSNLIKAGMPSDVCPEKWILDNPKALTILQREYIKAGSDIIYAPTFGANRIKLNRYGLSEDTKYLNTEIVKLSKSISDGKAKVAGDVSMTGTQLYPIGTLRINELIEVYKEQIKALSDAGADLIVIETMMSLQEVRAAIIASKEVSELPIMVSMTFEENGRTLYGTDSVTALLTATALGADAFGSNCGAGPKQFVELIEVLKEFASIPLIAKPNAGLPIIDKNGATSYNMDKKIFKAEMEKVIYAGANIVGGCCGTSPEYISEITSYKSSIKETKKTNKKYITSERNYKCLDECKISPAYIISDSDEMMTDIKEGCFDDLIDIAEELDEKYDVMLINIDGLDDNNVISVINETMQGTNLFLGFETDEVNLLEAALMNYPGIAIVSCKEVNDEFMSLVKKYGAIII